VGEAQPAGGQAPVTADVAGRRLRLVSHAAAAVLGGLLLLLIAVDAPLARLAHQSMSASRGSSPVWFSAAWGVLGFVVAWRRPGNPLGWIFHAVDLDSVRDDLVGVVHKALEPAQVSVWISQRG
jgi:ABC-type Na+ efflux pump permease subunit